MGSFETEFDLFESGTSLSAFEKASLLPHTPLVHEQVYSNLLEQSLISYLWGLGSHVSHDYKFLDNRKASDSLTGELRLARTPQNI